MQAVIASQPGSSKVLTIVQVPKPVLDIANEKDKMCVIVKVMASALNRADVDQRKGNYPPPPGESDILGLEVSGIIEEVGEKFHGQWSKGDRVCALLESGGYAEYAKIHGGMLMRLPLELSFVEGAAIPEVWLTAFQALFWLGEMDRRLDNRIVLIHAGASGVGTAAIQLAKLGSSNKVYVTVGSNEKVNFCKQLGADDAFNYKEVDWLSKILQATDNAGVDMIMDFMCASYWQKNLQCLAKDGIMTMQATLGGSEVQNVNLGLIIGKRLQIKGSTLRARSLEYKIQLTKAFVDFGMKKFEEKKLKPVISRTFTLEEVAAAHEFMESDLNIGKIVLTIAKT